MTTECDTYTAETNYPNVIITVANVGGTTQPAGTTGTGATTGSAAN